ncbi:cyanate hydratase [compost metagenome]
MNRKEATQQILDAKFAKGLTWGEIAKVSEHSESWVVTALLGQATMTRNEADKMGELLELVVMSSICRLQIQDCIAYTKCCLYTVQRLENLF